MNSHKMFRIELFTMDYGIGKDVVLLASLANGGNCPMLLLGLQSYANVKKWEIGYKDLSITISGNVLHIDKGTEAILKITEVEVLDLDVPTLSAYDAKKLMNEMDGGVNGSLDEGLFN